MENNSENLAFSLDEAKRLLKNAKQTAASLSRAELFHQLEEVEPICRLISELSISAKGCSDIQKMMAETKSLRQTDNPEKRKDLYDWNKPTQTLDGRAAIMLIAVLNLTLGIETDVIVRRLAPELLEVDTPDVQTEQPGDKS